MVPRILIVDDDQSFRFVLEETLRKEGYSVAACAGGGQALEQFSRERFDVVTLDIKMPDMDGFEVLRRMKAQVPEQLILIITAFGGQKIAVEAVQKGAYDYFTKPFELEELRVVIRRALDRERVGAENIRLRRELEGKYDFAEIIGNSGKMREIFALMRKVAATDVTVLIQGESGTGKELVARAIHYQSARREYPFVKINCAAIPDTILESELFGYERGAFTDAASRKIGKFEAAHQGTIFLDEIGDMSVSTQAKVLRVLQEKEFERLGSNASVKVDVRIIAATNKDLVRAGKEGQFREDLLYRINVVPLYLPPLRERREDIPLLFDHFMQRFSREMHKPIRHIALDAMELLMNYHWPGNIRELENVLQRAIVLAEQEMISKDDLPLFIRSYDKTVRQPQERADFSKSLRDMVQEITADVEKQLIIQALERTNWNRTDAARLLRVSRKGLFNKMKRYQLLPGEA
ncbi:MAG: sigma-54 dependent transcriptional regulator [Candidatus Omnitrophica bacterium]|nr:sigma-54 dependent transcriptional regulator [Candidatus Omnitrophota bacterium]